MVAAGQAGAQTMSEADGLRQRRPLRPQVVTDDDGQAPEAKDGSSFSGRVFRVTFLMLAVSLTVPLLGAMMLLESPIDPQPLSFKEPRSCLAFCIQIQSCDRQKGCLKISLLDRSP